MTRRGPNEGSIFERQDGRWAGSVHMGWIDGKRVRKHVIAHTRKEAADKMAALLKARDEHRPVPDQRHEGRTVPAPVARRGREADHPGIDLRELRRHRHPAPGARARPHRAREAVPCRCPVLPQPEGSERPVTAPGPDAPRGPAPGARDRGALGLRQPERGEARRHAPGRAPRDLAPDTGAGTRSCSSHRPRTGTGRCGSRRSRPVSGRASCWRCAGRTSTSMPAARPCATPSPTSAAP